MLICAALQRRAEFEITEAAGAELAEVGQVLAELGGFDAGGFGQGFAGDGADVVFLEALEATEVHGQSIDCLARDLSSQCFLQRREG